MHINNKTKILVTGGDGRFARMLKLKNKTLNLFFVNKKQCNILSIRSINAAIKRIKPKTIIHCAGLSRPMDVHEKDINKSIDLNIIGTANITKVSKLIILNLFIFPQAMSMRAQKVIIKKQTLLNHSTIMVCLN